jgi:hypothetical protein
MFLVYHNYLLRDKIGNGESKTLFDDNTYYSSILGLEKFDD